MTNPIYFLQTSGFLAAATKFIMANMQELIVAREEFAVRQESNKILIRSSAR
jgi:hypothetical protein